MPPEEGPEDIQQILRNSDVADHFAQHDIAVDVRIMRDAQVAQLIQGKG